jgi:hypothetical protein
MYMPERLRRERTCESLLLLTVGRIQFVDQGKRNWSFHHVDRCFHQVAYAFADSVACPAAQSFPPPTPECGSYPAVAGKQAAGKSHFA